MQTCRDFASMNLLQKHVESAHSRKLCKSEYVQLLAELDCLKIPCCYRLWKSVF